MPRVESYRDVDVPAQWDTYSDDAKVNYLCNILSRKSLLHLVAEMADVPDDEVGEQALRKAAYAHIIVMLDNADKDND